MSSINPIPSRQAFLTIDNLGKNRDLYLRGLVRYPRAGNISFPPPPRESVGRRQPSFLPDCMRTTLCHLKKGPGPSSPIHTSETGQEIFADHDGFVRFRGQQQFYNFSSFGSLNSSINRKFFKEKLTVTFSVNDIFATNKNDLSSTRVRCDASGFQLADIKNNTLRSHLLIILG